MTSTVAHRKEYAGLERIARRQGWTVAVAGSGHLRWTAPDGRLIVTASTPHNRRTFMNDRARLRRAGLQDRPESKKKEKETVAVTQLVDQDRYGCRNPGCSDLFQSRDHRDRHEQHSCLSERDSPATPESETETAKPAVVFRSERWKRVPCDVCGESITRQNMGRHKRARHSHDAPARQKPKVTTVATATPNTGRNVDTLVQELVEWVFPDGLPVTNPAVLRLMASWVQDTTTFLEQLEVLGAE